MSGARVRWTQAICERCWLRRHPRRQPVRLADREEVLEQCSFCGEPTFAGIYVRDDPETVPFPQFEDED